MTELRSSRTPVLHLLMVILLVVTTGCASPPARNPVPADLIEDASIPGTVDVRYWGDSKQADFKEWFKASDESVQKHYGGIYGKEHHYLALSGGGQKGAFGAGLLAGWTAHGDRPKFDIVSGVSTGALTAPYAFLGAEYDAVIKEVYLQHSTEDLAKKRGFWAIVKGDAVADVTGFEAQIKAYFTDEMIDLIGEEYRTGRELLIGTVNLDVARPVVWNIGAIAISDYPEKYQLIRKIIQASASLPIGFPPVMIDVEAGGASYEEMHVDGGVANQVFIYPLGVDWAKVEKKLKVKGKPKLYLIRNAQLKPIGEPVERKLQAIASASLDSLLRTQGLGDIYRIYIGTLRDGLEFNLAYIPDWFEDRSKEPFDPNTMRQLYEMGFEMAKNGYPWSVYPPGVDPVIVTESDMPGPDTDSPVLEVELK